MSLHLFKKPEKEEATLTLRGEEPVAAEASLEAALVPGNLEHLHHVVEEALDVL
jgi:hypothetical protein